MWPLDVCLHVCAQGVCIYTYCVHSVQNAYTTPLMGTLPLVHATGAVHVVWHTLCVHYGVYLVHPNIHPIQGCTGLVLHGITLLIMHLSIEYVVVSTHT